MFLKQLHISNLRNLESITLNNFSAINVIIGENGSGKTSILEAIHILSTGKSFRSHLKSRLIQYDKSALTLFCVLDSLSGPLNLGIEKSQSDDTRLRFQGETIASISEFAKHLPIQLLHPQSYELLDGGSKPRRAFVDWGVFHVEHNFVSDWNRFQRLLKQRNAALRSQLSRDEITLWDNDLVSMAERLNNYRQDYINQLIPLFDETLDRIANLPDIKIKHYAGWNQNNSLAELLSERLIQDIQLGYTNSGPQRADLRLTVSGVPVQHALSRGQQKLVVFALRFAQALLLQKQTGKTALFLIDDLASELDSVHRNNLLQLIIESSNTMQFILTGIDEDIFNNFEQKTMFHVKHGSLNNNSSIATVN